MHANSHTQSGDFGFVLGFCFKHSPIIIFKKST